MTTALTEERAPAIVEPGRRDDDDGGRIRCPITGELCRGVLAHLCEDYGCARKGGLSPDPREDF